MATKEKTKSASLGLLLAIYIALLVLLVATIGAAHFQLGAWSLPVAMSIAILKTVLVVLFFMNIRYGSQSTRIFATAGVLWLFMMFALIFGDYLTRSWIPKAQDLPEETPAQVQPVVSSEKPIAVQNFPHAP